MLTEAYRDAMLANQTIQSARARALFFQARVNLELFKHMIEQLHEAFENLNYHNFARAFGTCHMNDGIFGELKHSGQMATEKERVLGFLFALVTSGHRFTKSIIGMRKHDRGTDWRTMRTEITHLDRQYHRTRNALEHLHDAIAAGDIADNRDCGFSPEGILNCTDNDGQFTFDFTRPSLERVASVYEGVLEMLRVRSQQAVTTEQQQIEDAREQSDARVTPA